MILSDRDIRAQIEAGRMTIESDNPNVMNQIHASSMDLRLGCHFKIYKHSKYPVLDPMNMKSFEGVSQLIKLKNGEPFIVQPGEFVLGVTEETVGIPDDIVARVEGRSSLGRLGIVVHSTAGFVDAGFKGTITLEISNLNRMPVALYPGMRVCQLAFEQMTSPAEIPYNIKKCSKYQGQSLPEESRICIDIEFRD